LVFKNNNLISYLSEELKHKILLIIGERGGTILYKIAANDSIEFKYVINNTGVAIDAKLINIGLQNELIYLKIISVIISDLNFTFRILIILICRSNSSLNTAEKLDIQSTSFQ
jgi:hypothetical protein